jgi:membrane-bound ClpP family serine protease
MEQLNNSLTALPVLENIFLLVGIISLVVLLVSLAIDGIIDAFSVGDGLFSIPVISAFTALFGFVSYGSLAVFHTGADIAIILGIVAGGIGAVIAYALMRFLKASESNDSAAAIEFVGRDALLTSSIIEQENGSTSYGAISVTLRGNVYHFSAKAETPISKGEEVTIVEQLSSTLMLVKAVKQTEQK